MAKLAAAIKIEGIRELVKACKETGIGLDQLKEAHQKAAVIVLAAALPRMPERTGALKASYKASALQRGGKIASRLVYAGVSEFGGKIPRRGHKTMTLHKPTAKSQGLSSYYVYPAAKEKEAAVRDIYEGTISQLIQKTFRPVLGH